MILAIVFFVMGGASMLGIMAVVNKVTIADLFKRGEETEEKATEKQEAKGSVVNTPGGLLLNELDDAVSKVVEEVTPSVVNIKVIIQGQGIFGEIYEQEGIGSGVIYTEDGYIITNNHVAGNAEDIVVTLYDGNDYPATLKGADENTDVAVIKIEASGLKAANFSSTDASKVGDVVIAVGSPFGLQQSVTLGVISAKGRDITIPVNLIQTDAAINEGNSGGPLVNSNGEVIGINTLIISPSGASAGIGFAIPSNTVTNIADQIIKYGKAKIPYMGIMMDPNNTTGIIGVYVSGVDQGYPAENAGIMAGDVITEVDGEKISNPYELFAQILRHNVGDSVNITVDRNGDIFTVKLVLVETPTK